MVKDFLTTITLALKLVWVRYQSKNVNFYNKTCQVHSVHRTILQMSPYAAFSFLCEL